jgi:gas vesicle protein
MATFRKFMQGLVLGAIVGAGVTLLLTPYAGPRFRQEAETALRRVTDDVKVAALQKRRELELQLQDLRSPQKPE